MVLIYGVKIVKVLIVTVAIAPLRSLRRPPPAPPPPELPVPSPAPVWVDTQGWLAVRFYRGEVPRGEKMLFSGTDPESYITECTLVYED